MHRKFRFNFEFCSDTDFLWNVHDEHCSSKRKYYVLEKNIECHAIICNAPYLCIDIELLLKQNTIQALNSIFVL